ncbi:MULTISPECIES: hypothetical protein [unclassified Streptomyces]|nr:MULTISPECIES: hypothetical protein [unclassified Streptomyces]WSD92970.1 hypothetical protein OG758_01285 [Streptomyces sp. NBC_01474]
MPEQSYASLTEDAPAAQSGTSFLAAGIPRQPMAPCEPRLTAETVESPLR